MLSKHSVKRPTVNPVRIVHHVKEEFQQEKQQDEIDTDYMHRVPMHKPLGDANRVVVDIGSSLKEEPVPGPREVNPTPSESSVVVVRSLAASSSSSSPSFGIPPLRQRLLPLLVDHFKRPFSAKLDIAKGKTACEDSEQFWDGIDKLVPVEIPEDRRKLTDFPLVTFLDCFLREEEYNIPIWMMTQRTIIDLWDALDWNAICDFKFSERTPAWLEQLLELIESTFYRTVCLAMRPSQELSVTDHEQYRTLIKSEDTGLDTVFELAISNYAFLHDTEALFTYMMQTIFKDRHLILNQNSTRVQFARVENQAKVEKMKSIVLSYVDRISDDALLSTRRFYYDSLIMHDAHVRIHRRREPFDQRPSASGVFTMKHDSLYVIHCESKKDILLPRKDEEKGIEIHSIDAMFLQYCRGIRAGNPIKPVLGPNTFSGPDRSYSPTQSIVLGYPRIVYSRLLAQWVLYIKDEKGEDDENDPNIDGEPNVTYYHHPSLMVLYVFFRERFRHKYVKQGLERLDTIDSEIF